MTKKKRKEHRYNEEKFCIISQDHFLQLLEGEYHRFPELRPFVGGDRAGMLGKESAKAFAKRRHHEYVARSKRGPKPRNYRREYWLRTQSGIKADSSMDPLHQ